MSKDNHALLHVKNLSISYAKSTSIATNINFSLHSGKVLAIVGESGSGKTSIIRAIQQCLPTSGYVSSGDIFYKGKSILGLNNKEKSAMCGEEISTIFQDSGSMLNPSRTIGQQFVDYLKAHGYKNKHAIIQKIISMLTMVKLPNPEHIMRSYTCELSGGMRQRIGIAMATALTPSLLLADEPTSALDVTMQAQIISQMMGLKEKLNVAIILVTHNIGVASYMADSMIIMKEGAIIEQGTKHAIIENPQHEYTKELLNSIPV